MSFTQLRELKGLAFLATPCDSYIHGPAGAFQHAAIATGRLLQQGVHAISPVLLIQPMIERAPAVSNPRILAPFYTALMLQCASMVIADMPGWHEDDNTKMVYRLFVSDKRPVFLGLNLHRLSKIAPEMVTFEQAVKLDEGNLAAGRFA